MKQREHYDLIIKAITVAIAVVMGIVVVFICQMYRNESVMVNTGNTTEVCASETTTEYTIADTTTVHTTTMHTTTEEMITTEEQTTAVTTTVEIETTTKKKTQQATKATTTENPTKYANADISAWINKTGTTVGTRFKTPAGFQRMIYDEDSYAYYVQNLPLKAYGTQMYEYDGDLVENQSWCASVIVTEFHKRGWLQCADCVMKLVGDYLYEHERYSDIVFDNATGNRLKYTSWVGGDYSKSKYEKYMTEVYYSANTSSFKAQNESVRLGLKNIFPGAYFIMDKDSKHTYGHAVFVIDVAKNPKTGEVAFLLAQGSTPSQDMHVFLNPLHPNDPWYYSSEIGATFAIPFWIFDTKNLFYYNPIGIQYGEMETVPEPEQTATTDKKEPDDETTTVEQQETSMEQTTAQQSTTDNNTTEQSTTEEVTTESGTTSESSIDEEESEGDVQESTTTGDVEQTQENSTSETMSTEEITTEEEV